MEFELILTNDYSADNILYETTIKKIYKPIGVFSDNPDVDDLINWTAYNGNWYLSTDSYSGTKAIASSILSPYLASQSKSLQLNSGFDLSGSSDVIIQFYAKWDLERSFDYVQFEASNDGVNWVPLCGKITKPGSSNINSTYSNKNSNGFQPENEPLYDGDSRGDWQLEEININLDNNSIFYNQSTVYFRFEMNTDNSNQQSAYYNADFEGFSFDDFTIYNAQEISEPTELFAYETNRIKIYPVPFQNKISIELIPGEEIKHLSIYQANGQIVYQSTEINSNKMIINSSDWNNGIYFIKINDYLMYKVVKL